MIGGSNFGAAGKFRIHSENPASFSIKIGRPVFLPGKNIGL